MTGDNGELEVDPTFIRQVKPIEIPIRLLQQKTAWNLEEFCRYAVLATNWHAYVWGQVSEEWAAILLIDDRVYDSIFWETLIVDKEYRGFVPEVVRRSFKICEALARQLGRKYVTTCTHKPKAYLRMLGNPPGVEEVETRLRKEV